MRAIEKKRPPFMTRQRWAFVIVAFILLVVTLLFVFYRSVQSTRWSEEREARSIAAETANLQEINAMYKHVWQTVSWIVNGVDADGNDVYVWLPQEGEPYVTLAAEALSMENVRAKLLAAKPEAAVKHIRPALLEGGQCWEIFYSYDDGSLHYYYDFYNFYNGELIATYKLPAKTEP